MSQSWKKAKRVVGTSPAIDSKSLERESLPELSAFLGGVPTPDNKAYELAPHTLTMWIEGDYIHWCLQSKQEANKLFGSFMGLEDISAKMEAGLEKEEFSVRKRDK